MSSSFKKKITPYLFIAPWVIGFIAFTLGPLVYSLFMSFHDWSVTSEPVFIGLKNFKDMFFNDPQFYKSLSLTIKFALIFVPLNMIIALLMAMLLAKDLKFMGFFRTTYYLPSMVSSVAVSMIWGWIFHSKYGVLNYVLSLFGIEGPQWLMNPTWAIVAVVIASAWGVGNMMLIFYTNIKSIPAEYYEAARVDGAGPIRQFFSITLPIITPTILFNLVTSTISALQQLSLVILLTGGGPLKSTYFYGLYVYENAFKHQKLGYASANAWIMFIIIMLLTALIFKSSDLWVFYENEVKGED